MRTQPTSNDSLISTTSTTTDKKFNQAKQIYAIAARFTDATRVLEDLCTAVSDRDYSRSKLLQCIFCEEVCHASPVKFNQYYYHRC